MSPSFEPPDTRDEIDDILERLGSDDPMPDIDVDALLAEVEERAGFYLVVTGPTAMRDEAFRRIEAALTDLPEVQVI